MDLSLPSPDPLFDFAPFQSRFEVHGVLGEGTQAKVYAARDHLLGLDVAVKVYDARADLPVLTREFRTVCDVVDRGLVRAYDLVQSRGLVGLVLERFDGPLTSSFVRDASGDLLPERLAEVVEGLLSGVAALHRNEVIHGDIKASNVLVRGGRVALSDYGFSWRFRAQRDTGFSGTPSHAAPELFSGEPSSEASDLFALGVLILQLASGQLPERVPRLAHPWLDPSSPELPRALPDHHTLVRELLSDDPSRRSAAFPEHLRIRPGGLRGREGELRLILSLARQSRLEGRPTRADVVAPSGMGKSRFLEELTTTLEVPTALVRCQTNDRMPFAAIDAILEQLSPHPGAQSNLHQRAAAVRRRLFDASFVSGLERESVLAEVTRVLASFARAKGLVILLDDADRGDEDSGRLLAGLADAPGVFVCVAYREKPARGGLLDALAGWGHEAVLPLPPLPDRDICALVRAHPGMAERGESDAEITKRCRGNPALATMLRPEDLDTPSPFPARLEALPGGARELCLLLSAMAAPTARHVLLAAASTPSAESLRMLLAEGWLVPTRSGDELRLRHESISEPAWRALPVETQRHLHARLADALERVGAPAEQLARQAFASGQLQRAAEAARSAAPLAFSLRAFARAAELEAILVAAAREKQDRTAEREARSRRALGLEACGHRSEAAEEHLAAAALAPTEEARARLELEGARALLAAGDLDAGKALIETHAVRRGLRISRSPLARLAATLLDRTKLKRQPLEAMEPIDPEESEPTLDAALHRVLTFDLSVYEPHPEAQSRLLLSALSSRHREDLVLALSMELVTSALIDPEPRWVGRVRALLDRCLADASVEARGQSALLVGFAALCEGHHAEAERGLRRAVDIASGAKTVPWFADLARVNLLGVRLLMGRLELVVTEATLLRATWLADGKKALVAHLDASSGFLLDLAEGRPSRAVRRLRRCGLGKATEAIELGRVTNLANTLCHAGRHPAARSVLWRHRSLLLAKLVESYGRVAIAYSIFLTIAPELRRSRGLRIFVRALARLAGSSRHAAGPAFASALRAAVVLAAGRSKRGRTLALAAVGTLDQVGLHAHARGFGVATGVEEGPDEAAREALEAWFRPQLDLAR